MIFLAPTLTEMWEQACDNMIFARKQDGRIFTGSSMTIAYDHQIKAESMEFEADVWKDLHLTKGRFPVLQRTYLDPGAFDAFVTRCHGAVKHRGAVTSMPAVNHGPRGINRTKKTGNYAHGPCIMGWAFRVTKSKPYTPILSMHSRVSYITYMGCLDLALCYHMAKEIANEIGCEVEDFAFSWYCDAFQIAHMQSVSYFWNRKHLRQAIRDEEKYPDAEYPTIKLMRKTLKSFKAKRREGFAPEDEKFAQLMRYRRRWESRVNKDGQWPDLPISELSLAPLRSGVVEEDGDDAA
jgi:hypothetical protein